MERNKNTSRFPTCSQCRNHGKPFVPLKGHSKNCPHRKCTCEMCILIVKRGDLNRQKSNLMEKKNQEKRSGRQISQKGKKAESVGYKTKHKRKTTPKRLAPSETSYNMAQPSPFAISQQKEHGTGLETHYEPNHHFQFSVAGECFSSYPMLPPYPIETDATYSSPQLATTLSPSRVQIVTSRSFDRNDSQARLEELQVSPTLCQQSYLHGNATDNCLVAPPNVNTFHHERPAHYGNQNGILSRQQFSRYPTPF